MSDEAFTLNTKNLDAVLKALKENMSRARVGILGDKTNRTSGGKQAPTNATIGAYHEFGTDKMPQRSFLRVPIAENLQKNLESSGAFGKDEMMQVAKSGTMLPWLLKISAIAEKIVGDAFDTGGFGKWPKWKTKGYENNTGMLLVDTQQLRNSITSEVK